MVTTSAQLEPARRCARAGLFEALSPNEAGTLADVSSTVAVGKETKGKQRLEITDMDGTKHEFLITKDKQVLANDDEVVNKSEMIVDGSGLGVPAVPQDILHLLVSKGWHVTSSTKCRTSTVCKA